MSILIKPIITEKMTDQGEKFNRFGFVVDRNANKIEIKNNYSYQDIRSKVYLDSIECIYNAINKLSFNDLSNFKEEKGGKYYKPISDSKLAEVFIKYKNEI